MAKYIGANKGAMILKNLHLEKRKKTAVNLKYEAKNLISKYYLLRRGSSYN